jgi:hypothetical protein
MDSECPNLVCDGHKTWYIAKNIQNKPLKHILMAFCWNCQAWTTSYQLTPFTALLDLRAPWGWQQREKNESGGVECRRIDKIKSSEYMSEYPTIYT